MKNEVLILKKGRKFQLSENLNQSEIDCKCTNSVCVHTFYAQRTIDAFEKTRLHFGKPIFISSGFRCIIHNKKVGGVKYSDHTKGDAMDIQCGDKLDLEELHEIAKNYFDYTYIDYEKQFIHCSKRA